MVVTSVAGSVTSVVANLTVLVPVAITTQPQGQLVVVGADAAFAVAATGTGPLFYQ